MLEKSGLMVEDEGKERMVAEITRIAGENMSDVQGIERLVGYAVTGD